ncbi:MAG: PEP/pyruvate-binding domain-containing protein [Christensenellales bacterium]|jgi:phosphohistidine swiveling domain-containing protein
MVIYQLGKIPKTANVGGKAKGLSLLSRCGLNVPKGFVAADIDSDLCIQITGDYYENSGLKTVAVRSSATSEDGADFSGAGQYSTYLDILGKNAVKKAVRDCIVSLNSETAKSYGSYFSGAKSEKMCVIVQQMIDADISGVCFTQHPGNKDGILIEAVEGLGEKLVSGKAEAHTYFVPKDTLHVQGDSLLSAEMIREIAAGAKKASSEAGCELDTEWAVKDGLLYWLQARPITVTEETDAFELDAKDITSKSVLTTCNVGEMLPGAVTPLSLSTSVASIDFGMRKMIVKAGAAKSFDDVPPGSCVTNFGNHLFINITALYAIADHVIGATREGVELSLCGQILEDTPKPPVPQVTKINKINNAKKYFGILLGVGRACKKINKLAEAAYIPLCKTAGEQIKEISNRLYILDEAFWLHYITSAYSGSMSSAIFLILMGEGYSVDDAKSKLAGLLEDIDGIESVDILRSLRYVARALMSENPDVIRYTAEELAVYVKKCGPKSREALDAFMKRHGHRAIREAEMRSMSWHMDELSLCNYLKSIIATGADEKTKLKMVDKNIEAVLKGRKSFLRLILRYIIGQARRGVVCREFTKSMSIKALDRFKTAYRHLAYMLEQNGALPDADLIFFLTHEEIIQLIQKNELSLIKKALARRRVLEEQKQFKFDEICVGIPRPLTNNFSMGNGSTVLTGSSISRGKATGKARVVKNVEEANMLQKGEIMVASFTDIGWSPYYCMLGGLVTEVGSALSHGAVVAREYALPLVSNVPFATQVIKTGDVISLDGYTGEVAIIG